MKILLRFHLGMFLDGPGSIILAVLTQNPNLKVKLEDINDSRVKKIFPLLVDARWEHITEGQSNNRRFDQISKYLSDM